MIHLFGLSDSCDRLTRNFSLGMKQRLGLARAMLHEPEFLILDEPTNGLDPVGIHEIRETLKKLNTEKGLTILVSSHILSEVEQIANRVGIINAGNLIDEFSLEDFRRNSNSLIEIKTSNVEAAVKLLSSSFKLKEIETNGNDTLFLPSNIERPAAINKMLIENGLEVNHLIIRGETLEDRFLRLTGGNK